jgi:alpha-glucosidase
MTAHDATTDRWWEGAVIYQIYPRSFADSNGDGIGDLEGIRSHLDHLRGADGALDVDAAWISPFYPSPLYDFGYDISDYTDVAPEFGTLADFDRLVEAAHARGLRVILDLVPCHTSTQHPWFVDSRADRDSARRDWFIWADPAPDGGPPNNWESAFGGPAWELDPGTGQYYLHSFYPEQADLNWRNPAVAEAIHDVMRFWFARGVDGLRVDAIPLAVKDALLRDNPPYRRPALIPGFAARATQEPLWNIDRPEVHDVIRGLRRVADEAGGRLLIGEAYAPLESLVEYLGHGRDDEFHLAWNFELLHTPFEAGPLGLAIERAEALHPEGTWPSIAFSNHDNPRHATRWGGDRVRLAALVLLTLRGVPTIYMGEEIGMTDHPALPDGVRVDRAGRDAQRTPMQWTDAVDAGFGSARPWLPFVDAARTNVADQVADPTSTLSLYRRLLALRRRSAALRCGTHRSIFGTAPDVLAWVREAPDGGERVLVLANLANEARQVRQQRCSGAGTVLAGTLERYPHIDEVTSVELGPLEGLVIGLGRAAASLASS